MSLKFPKGQYNKKRRLRKSKRNNFKSKGKEAILQEQAEGYLEACGIPYIRIPDNLWSYLMSYSPDWVKFIVVKYLKGIHDLTILFPNGRYISVELKRNEKLDYSVAQKSWRDNIGLSNSYLLSNFEDFQRLIKKIRMEEEWTK